MNGVSRMFFCSMDMMCVVSLDPHSRIFLGGGATMRDRSIVGLMTIAAAVVGGFAPLETASAQSSCTLSGTLGNQRLLVAAGQVCTVRFSELTQGSRAEIRSGPTNGLATIEP